MRSLRGYEIGGELGKGGMGRVLRVRHLATGIERAVKVMEGVSGPEAVARFRREAEALAKASAAGAVPIHESGLERGALWYVMDLMAGGSLRDRCEAAGGALPWREAASLMARIARIVDRCHEMGLVHRDLKPENVLFDDSGTPRLADFGCVRDSGQRSLTEAGELLGTLSYMAPEQLNGLRVDGRADVFALGVILHELVASERPFKGRNWSELALAIGEGARRPLTEIPDVPEALEEIVRRATAVDPAARYQTAADLAAALDLVVQEERVAERSSPLRILIPVAFFALGLAGLAGAWAAGRSSAAADGVGPTSASRAGPSTATATATASGAATTSWPDRTSRPRVTPEVVAAATLAADRLAAALTVEQALGDQKEIRRAMDAWLRHVPRVRDLPPEALAPLVSSCLGSLRRLVCTASKPSDWLMRLQPELHRGFDHLDRGAPPELTTALAVLDSFCVPQDRKKERHHGDLLAGLGETCPDPVLATAALWAASDCWARSIVRELSSGRDVESVEGSERAFELDRRSTDLLARIPEGELRDMLATGPMRAHYEALRDLHKHVAGRLPDGPDRRRELDEVIRCALAATTRVERGSGTVFQAALVLLELAPRSASLVTPFFEEFREQLEPHFLYVEYVRVTLERPERAIEVVEDRRPRLEREPPNERQGDMERRIGDLRALIAIEANALMDLGRLEEARARIARVKELHARVPGDGIASCHPENLGARLRAKELERRGD